jgi:predicted glutamine amidotransferase
MCGIFGWNVEKVNEDGRFGMLALALASSNQSRGSHGWGFAGYRKDGTLVYDRGTDGFVQNAPMPELLQMPQILCHTRFATTGPRTKIGSHPFQIGTIIGAHNGVIHNWLAIEDKYTDRKNFRVDSEHIFAHLAEDKDLDELEGYGAVEFLDTEDAWKQRDIKGFCFNHKDFAVAFVKALKGCVWSSSETHLVRALKLVDYEHTLYAAFEGGKLYHIHPDGLKVDQDKLMSLDKSKAVKREVRQIPFGMTGGRAPLPPTSQDRSTGTLVGSTPFTVGPSILVVKACTDCGIYWHESEPELCWGCNKALTASSLSWLQQCKPKYTVTLDILAPEVAKQLRVFESIHTTEKEPIVWISASHINRLAHRKNRKRIIEAIRGAIVFQKEMDDGQRHTTSAN